MTMGSLDALTTFAAAAPVREAPATAPTPVEAARAFEALALERLLEPASRPLFGEGLLDGGSAGRLHRQLFLAEVARLAAERGALGLADALAPGLTRGDEGGGR